MSFSLNCLESLTAISFGLYAVTTGDLGTMAGGSVAGTTLLRLWSEHRSKRPLDSERALTKAREAVAKDFAVWSEREWVSAADIRAADLAMKQHLADCIPDKETLGGLVISDQRYPKCAARYVVDKLAKRDPLFQPEGVPRDFALAVVESAVRSALGDEEYTKELQVYMLAAVGEAVQNIRNLLLELKDEIAQQHANLLERIPDLALTREISELVGAHPKASLTELAGDVAKFARDYRSLLEQLEAYRSVDNELQNNLQFAREALEAGDLGLARQRIALAETAARALATAPMRDLARVLDLKARSSLLDRNWELAAHSWTQAAKLLTFIDSVALDTILISASYRLHEFGERYGVISALAAAAETARSGALSAAARGNAEAEAAHNGNIGNSFLRQGMLVGGAEGVSKLENAVTAYRAALQFYTEANSPANWALMQSNLGNAYLAQGKRFGGAKGVAKLEEAVTAYRNALRFQTETELPTDWATTQNNLGITLSCQGERLGGPGGALKLEEAITAYRAALRVRTDAGLPDAWAMTQNNLASVLKLQSACLGDSDAIAKLEEAITIYRAALRVRTEADRPIAWAMTQNNLGAALAAQGVRHNAEEGVAKLEEAVAAYRNALRVQTEAELPVDWAQTQNNLGIALQTQGMLLGGSDGVAKFEEAIAVYRAALRVFTKANLPADWAMTQNNLGNALMCQGQRLGGVCGAVKLEEASTAHFSALEVRTRADQPSNWAGTRENMAIGFLSLADCEPTRARKHLREAEAAVLDALRVYTPAEMPYFYEKATTGLNFIRARLASLDT